MSSPPISSLLEQQARRQPDALFLVTATLAYTYGEAEAAVADLRADLRSRGVEAGDRALLLARNGPEFVLAWLALSGLDATMVPVHSQLPDLGLRGVIEDSGARWALGTAGLLDARAECLEAVGERGLIPLILPFDGDRAPVPAVEAAENPCAILYTSGTTGPPKGVLLGHHAYFSSAAVMAEGLGLNSHDRILTALPLFHANPQFYALATALQAGASLALLERFDPSTFLEDASSLGATGFTYVGTILAMLVKAGAPKPEHGIRFCVGGGAPESVWREVESWGIQVRELYGSTETAGFVTLNTVSEAKIGTCGRVRKDMELAIVDPDDNVLPQGSVGEIVVRPSRPAVIFDGYHGKADITLSRMRNLWLHTSDAGHLDEDGYLVFNGRLDHRIRRGGENVDASSVETILIEHPEVIEAAVVGVPDEVMGEEVKAVIVATKAFDPWDLHGFLDGKLPRLAWPRYVEVREALPKTSTEKVIVSELRSTNNSIVDLRSQRSPVTTLSEKSS